MADAPKDHGGALPRRPALRPFSGPPPRGGEGAPRPLGARRPAVAPFAARPFDVRSGERRFPTPPAVGVPSSPEPGMPAMTDTLAILAPCATDGVAVVTPPGAWDPPRAADAVAAAPESAHVPIETPAGGRSGTPSREEADAGPDVAEASSLVHYPPCAAGAQASEVELAGNPSATAAPIEDGEAAITLANDDTIAPGLVESSIAPDVAPEVAPGAAPGAAPEVAGEVTPTDPTSSAVDLHSSPDGATDDVRLAPSVLLDDVWPHDLAADVGNVGPHVETTAGPSPRMLDEELAAFRLAPEECRRDPAPIPGLESLIPSPDEPPAASLAVVRGRTSLPAEHDMAAVGEPEAFASPPEPREEPRSSAPRQAPTEPPASTAKEPAWAEVATMAPAEEESSASTHGRRALGDAAGCADLRELAEADDALRAFTERATVRDHVIETLEAVARRVRDGEIVPQATASATPEAVLASVLASLLASRT